MEPQLTVTYLEVAQLSKLLVAVVEFADELLLLLVRLQMRPDVAALGEALAALIAVVWALSSMAALVCLSLPTVRSEVP
jgi:hypothetical protein